jgi:REP element-mobilizing transposase RayT
MSPEENARPRVTPCKQSKVEVASRRLSSAPTNILEPAPISGAGSIPITYFDPNAPIADLTGNLPHWRQSGTTYFVTFRLADSLPLEKLALWRREQQAWLRQNPTPHTPAQRQEYFDRFPRRLQTWLDAGCGSRILGVPEVNLLVREALQFFDGQRYKLDEFVVASNHVHAILTPFDEFELSDILHSWKSFTAHKIVKIKIALDRLQGAKAGGNLSKLQTPIVWQKESFDHIVRSPESLGKFRDYIRAHDQNDSGACSD